MTVTTQPSKPAAGRAGGALRQVGDLAFRPPKLTVPQMFHRTVASHRSRAALQHKAGGRYESLTYGELEERVRHFALGLVELGVGTGDRVALLSENRPEWAVVDLAALSIGAVNVPLYATLPPPQVEYVVRDSEATVAVVSTEKQLDKLREVWSGLPRLRWVVVMDPPGTLPEAVLSMEAVAARGAARPGGEEEFRRLGDAVQPDDLCSIIYTSGTTGDPKGAMLTHDNFMSNAQAVTRLVKIGAEDTFLSFLPLSHVFERIAGHYLSLTSGATTAYAESIFTVATNLAEIQPTVMASVPRLYESMQSRVMDRIAKLPPSRQRLARWALGIGWRCNSRRVLGESPGPLAALLYPLADRLVLKKIRDGITGGRMRASISGGAPLPIETARFLVSVGVPILEGYGLTETSPVISVNLPDRVKLGTVGPVIPGVEVRIAEDGEILSRGPHIMRGYYNKPEDTARAIDAEGWFHTGDIGELDEEGYLRITDRKKDILVLANGKNVAPQPIEARLKASPYIASAVLFGDRQPQVVALIVPDFDHLKQWARQKSLETADSTALVQNPQVKKLYREEIERLTTDLADFEKVRRHTLVSRDFSQDRGELTPTLKIKRKVVAEHFQAEIQAMYGGRPEG